MKLFEAFAASALSTEHLVALMKHAGRIPIERDTLCDLLNDYGWSASELKTAENLNWNLNALLY